MSKPYQLLTVLAKATARDGALGRTSAGLSLMPLTSTSQVERITDSHRERSFAIPNQVELALKQYSGMIKTTSRTRSLSGSADSLGTWNLGRVHYFSDNGHVISQSHHAITSASAISAAG